MSVNVTVAGPTGQGYLTFYSGDQAPPTVSTINFLPNVNRANNAILSLSKDGVLGVQAFVGGVGQVHLIVDVGGYFD